MTSSIWNVSIINPDPALMAMAGAVTGSASGAFGQAKTMLHSDIKDEDWACTVNGREVTFGEFMQLASNARQTADFVAIAPGGAARIESHYEAAVN
jgi:hypothetical protein